MGLDFFFLKKKRWSKYSIRNYAMVVNSLFILMHKETCSSSRHTKLWLLWWSSLIFSSSQYYLFIL